MAKQTLDYHAMYIVAGDIVGSIGRYSNTLSSISGKVDSANSTIDKARKYNGKWVYDGEKKSGDKTYKIYKQININDSAARSNLNVLSNRIERGVKDLKSLRNEANESEAVAAGIKAHVKKMQATLDPSDIAKIWSKLGLSIDLNNAVNGNKVGISDKGEDWDGLITFKRVSDKNGGIYLVLKNGIAMGYCTAEQKKSYYKELCKNNKNIKKMVDDETTERTKDTQKYANKMKANADYYDQASRERLKRNDDANPTILEKTGADFKVDGTDKLPDDLVKFINKDFAGAKGLKVVIKKTGDIYNQKGRVAYIYDSNGKKVGAYQFNVGQSNTARRTSYDWNSAGKVIGANLAGLGAGAAEGVPKFFGGVIDLGAKGAGLAAGALGNKSLANDLKAFAKKEYVSDYFDKNFYSTDGGKWIYNNGSKPEFAREAGNVIGEQATGVGVGKVISVVKEATNATFLDEATAAVMKEPGAQIMGETSSKVMGEVSANVMEEPFAKVMEESGAKVMEESGAKIMEETSSRASKIEKAISKVEAEEVAADNALKESGNVKKYISDMAKGKGTESSTVESDLIDTRKWQERVTGDTNVDLSKVSKNNVASNKPLGSSNSFSKATSSDLINSNTKISSEIPSKSNVDKLTNSGNKVGPEKIYYYSGSKSVGAKPKVSSVKAFVNNIKTYNSCINGEISYDSAVKAIKNSGGLEHQTNEILDNLARDMGKIK